MCSYISTIQNLETGETQSSEPLPLLSNAVGAGSRMLHEHVEPWPRDDGWSAFRTLMRFRRINRGGYLVTVAKV